MGEDKPKALVLEVLLCWLLSLDHNVLQCDNDTDASFMLKIQYWKGRAWRRGGRGLQLDVKGIHKYISK